MGIRRVEIDGGGWLDLKEKVKIGDVANVNGYAFGGIGIGSSGEKGSFLYNMVRQRIALVTIRIINWDLRDEADKPIDYPAGKLFDDRVRIVATLDDDIFTRIETAVDAFVESLSAEKNGSSSIPVAATVSGPDSP